MSERLITMRPPSSNRRRLRRLVAEYRNRANGGKATIFYPDYSFDPAAPRKDTPAHELHIRSVGEGDQQRP